jgi:hypothetical protein
MSAIAIGGGFGPLQKTTLPTTSSRGATIAKSAGLGALLGAAAGVGVSLLTHIVPLPIAAAIGGVAGLAIGGLIGFLRTRNQDAQPPGVFGGNQYIQPAPPVPPGVGTGGLPPQIY